LSSNRTKLPQNAVFAVTAKKFQRGRLGKAHQLVGEQLPKLLDELNEVLAA
jgi:hypothetical protein